MAWQYLSPLITSPSILPKPKKGGGINDRTNPNKNAGPSRTYLKSILILNSQPCLIVHGVALSWVRSPVAEESQQREIQTTGVAVWGTWGLLSTFGAITHR